MGRRAAVTMFSIAAAGLSAAARGEIGQGDVVARKVLTGSCGGICTEERAVITHRKAPRR